MNPGQIFKEIVENIFSRWTALQLAVEHGMGGRNGGGLERAIEMCNYVSESCIANPNVGESDLVDLLEDIMDEEFDTVCDDGSTREVSQVLIKYLQLLQQGKMDEIKQGIDQLRPHPIWIRPGHKINYVKSPEDSSSESDDDDDDEEMDQEVAGPGVSGPSTSGSTVQMEEEDMEEVEPGWTVVKTKKRK